MNEGLHNLKLNRKGTQRFLVRWGALSVIFLLLLDDLVAELAGGLNYPALRLWIYRLEFVGVAALFAYVSAYIQDDSIPR